jgi:oxygen-dependent protoporphyrinogen oxidase
MRRSFVMRGGSLFPIPEGLSGLVPARLEPILESQLFSNEGKQRFLQERSIPAGGPDGDESLAAFMTRRFGQEIYGRLIEPLMAGIYAGDGRELSLAATFPQLRALELEYGSLLRGLEATQAARAADTPRPGFLLSGWHGELVNALTTRLRRVRIGAGSEVRRLSRSRTGFKAELVGAGTSWWTLHWSPFRHRWRQRCWPKSMLIWPMPCTRSPCLHSHGLGGLPLPAIPRPLNGFGYLVPRQEARSVLASTWSSVKFPHRAPADHALLRAFIGRAGDDDIVAAPEHDLLEMARHEWRTTLDISAVPTLTRVYRWPRGMPQYTLGHADRLAMIHSRLQATPGLFLAGNGYRGVGIPDCIEGGEMAAEQIAALFA